MSRQRDLQKLLEFGQMDLSNKKQKALDKIKRDLKDRFFKDIPFTETAFTTLVHAQDRLSDIGEALVAWKKDGVEMDVLCDNVIITLNNIGADTGTGAIQTVIPWEEYLRVQFLFLLNGITKEDLIPCKQCGRLFVVVGKKRKEFCSPRCGVDWHRK